MKNTVKFKFGSSRALLGTLFLPFVLFFFSAPLNGQISYGGRPLSREQLNIEEIPVVKMPQFDINELRKKALGEPGPKNLKSLDFAKSFDVGLTPENSGKWTTLEDGTRVWRVMVTSRGAYSLNLIFDRYLLLPGSTVFLYNSDMSQILGGFNHLNNQSSGSLAISPVRGDTLVLELQVPPGKTNWGELSIGTISHDYLGVFDHKDQQFGLSGECNIDINCPEGNLRQMEKNSVVRLIVDGSRLCSGVLLNNTEEEQTPYMLTANHCIENGENATNTVAFFHYESPSCNGPDGTTENTLSGSTLRASSDSIDFSLVELNDIPPVEYRPYYAGWSRKDEAADSSVCIHHPMGDVKKISIDHDPPSIATFSSGYLHRGSWLVEKWDIGTTEGGSSGSPLFDQNNRVVGTLIGGDAYCGYSVNDYYARFDKAWDTYPEKERQLKAWLDPGERDYSEIDGMNPHSGLELSADFEINTTEVCEGNLFVFTDYSTGEIDSYFWDFGEGAYPATSLERGPHFIEYDEGGPKTVRLRVDDGEDFVDTEKEIDLFIMSDNLPVAGFDYTPPRQLNENEIEVEFIDLSQNAERYYWEFGNRAASTLENPIATYRYEGEYEVMLMIRNMMCTDKTSKTIDVTVEELPEPPFAEELKIYPVPAADHLFIELSRDLAGPGTVQIANMSGQLMLSKNYGGEDYFIEIKVSQLSSGIYLIKIFNKVESITKKIAIVK